jgi:50S ribosomal subunit-associated GTPase HflX
LPNSYVLLVGNKADLVQERQIGHQEIKDFADRNKLESVETSALNGKGVKEAFTRLALEIAARVKNGMLKINTGMKGIQELAPFEAQVEKKEGGCC